MTLISKVLTYATSNLSRETRDMIKKLQRLLGRSQNAGRGRALTAHGGSWWMKEPASRPALPKTPRPAAGCQVASVAVTATMQKQVRAQLVLRRFTYST